MQDDWHNNTGKAVTIWYSNDPKSLQLSNTVNLASWKKANVSFIVQIVLKIIEFLLDVA